VEIVGEVLIASTTNQPVEGIKEVAVGPVQSTCTADVLITDTVGAVTGLGTNPGCTVRNDAGGPLPLEFAATI